MTTERWLYLASVLVLTVPVLLDEWVIGHKRLRPYWRILVAVSLAGALYAATEGVALRWLLWADNPEKILNVQIFGAQLETYLVNLLVFPIIAGATLLMLPRAKKR